jgi:hypothetical protein
VTVGVGFFVVATSIAVDFGMFLKHRHARQLGYPVTSEDTQAPSGLWRRARDIPL